MTKPRLYSRSVIRLQPESGEEDVREFLQGLVTNDVRGRLPAYAALLTPQGKTLFDFIVWDGGEGAVLIDCEAAQAEAMAKRLSMYRLRRKIAISVEPGIGVFWQADGEVGEQDPRLAELGRRWVADTAEDDSNVEDAWLRHRLSFGVPEGAAELGDVLWLETNAVELNGVSFEKGCYVGQENTARMNWRQKVNRRVVVVPAGTSDPKRRKALHEDIGLAVDLLRLADIDAAALPAWQASGVADQPG